jgi:ATP-dependent helicase/nuclease subunit A
MKNTLIRASAGTGKTFALATRMIRLMLLHVEPHHIVALTFSRAAAGEIFNTFAKRLAKAAASQQQAAVESANIFNGLSPELAAHLRNEYGMAISQSVFASLLRTLIASQHISLISTIDSFMARMVQVFPLELGLQGSMAIMEDYQIAREKKNAINALLASTADDKSFFEAFRLATIGRVDKSFEEALSSYVEKCHGRLHEHPRRETWGDPATIWPAGAPFPLRSLSESRGRLQALADQLCNEIRADWDGEREMKMWDDFCMFIRTFKGTFPSSLSAGVKNVLAAYTQTGSTLSVKYYKKEILFDGKKARLIREAIETLYGIILHTDCVTTQGIYTLMRQFESEYERKTRSKGLLTFADIPHLIARLDASVRQNIEYRFDSRFRHWGLDEFQDTSHAQWQAIRNLVEEVIQAMDEERSLFIVGDMKQAIYGWRGGDVAIFDREIQSGHYTLEDLSVSYRYGPQIADFVNRIFNGRVIADLLLPFAPVAGKKWEQLWCDHGSQQADGFVSVERVVKNEAEGEATIDTYIEATATHLQCIKPWERGITAAILVRSNEQGKAFADGLRRKQIPVVWEGESAISDTPVVTALLHLLHAAEHPGDTLVWRHVCATPLLRTLFPDVKRDTPETLPVVSQRVLDDVSRQGLARTLLNYIEALKPAGMDCFTQTRLDALIQAAASFADTADATTTLTDFTDFVNAFTTRDVADTSTVKILTIHRSKGLGFDCVFVPIIEKNGLDAYRSDDMLVSPDHAWLLTHPGKQVALADRILSVASANDMETRLFEDLCVAYVAMTRARRALYVLLKPLPKRETTTLYFSTHIAETLSVSSQTPWSNGQVTWYEMTVREAPQSAEAVMPSVLPRRKREVIRRVTPSSRVYDGRVASELFTPQEGALAAERGTRLHAALSKIEWLAPDAVQPEDIPREDLDLIVDSAFRAALSRPSGVIDLWREIPFELVIDNQWISGTFDRVIFFEECGVRRAEIVDFKSNRRRDNESEADFATRMQQTYTSQMNSYRLALAHLAKIALSDIRCTLLLTDTRQAVTV